MEKLSPQGQTGKYMALYKCQLCGKVMKLGEAQEARYNDLPELMARVLKNQMMIGSMHYQAPLMAPCKCDDGSCGAAYFAGFKRV